MPFPHTSTTFFSFFFSASDSLLAGLLFLGGDLDPLLDLELCDDLELLDDDRDFLSFSFAWGSLTGRVVIDSSLSRLYMILGLSDGASSLLLALAKADGPEPSGSVMSCKAWPTNSGVSDGGFADLYNKITCLGWPDGPIYTPHMADIRLTIISLVL